MLDGWTPQSAALPAALTAASAVVWSCPDRGLAVVLLLLGALLSPLGPLLYGPYVEAALGTAKRTSAKQLSDVLLATLLELARSEHEELMLAFTGSIRRAVANKEVMGTMKSALIEAAQDEDLQQQLLTTMTRAGINAFRDRDLRTMLLGVVKEAVSEALKDKAFMEDMVRTISMAVLHAAENRELRDATLKIVKEAVFDALSDERFMEQMLSMLTKSVVAASRDVELRDAMVGCTKEAVRDALKDDAFISSFREALCDSLKDSNIYRSAAAGVVGSLNPFRRSAAAD